MNNSVFGKTMANMRKNRDIKLVTTDKRRNQLALEPNYHKTKWISEDSLVKEMKKIKVNSITEYIQVSQYQKLVEH